MKEERYIRQVSLPQVGSLGQEKLRASKVLVVGAGGLGNALLPYLASAGIGNIGIIDGDFIVENNLHRQVLFSMKDLGELKAVVVAERLKIQFPDSQFNTYAYYLDNQNSLDLFRMYDVIVDATDDIDTRYLINDAAHLANKPWVHASVYRFQFQLASFNVNKSGNYRNLYPKAPSSAQSCAEAGVMPSTVAIAGMYQANEVFKIILGIGNPLLNTMLLVDLLNNSHHHFTFESTNIHVSLDEFEQKKELPQLTWDQSQEMLGTYLDVRSVGEEPILDFVNYVQIPAAEVLERRDEVPSEGPIFVFCQGGKRSKSVAKDLLKYRKQLFVLSENAPEIHQHTQSK